MRRILWLGLIAGVLWCLWWLAGSGVMQVAGQRWLDDRRAEGWQADANIGSGGFPTAFQTRLTDLALADPETGVAVSMSQLQIEADAWWPGHLRLRLPSDPIRLSAPDAKADLVMKNGRMRLDLAPSTQLEMKQLAWTADRWDLRSPDASLVLADALTLSMRQSDQADLAHVYDLVIDLDALEPGTPLRDRLRLPGDWPLRMETLTAQMTVSFDRPWDRRAIEERRPQPRQITLSRAEAVWGALRLAVAADLTVAEGGAIDGKIHLQARNWNTMLDMAEAAGALPSRLRPQAQGILQALANASGGPNSIDVTVTAANGFLSLGFIPIAPAPRLILR
jgi:hypothetical protein